MKIELREFTGADFYGWQGADLFADGSKPFLAVGEEGTLIVCGSETKDGTAVIMVYFGDDCDKWAFKSIDTKEQALKDAKILVAMLDEEFDEAQFHRFGFTVVC